MIHVEDKTLTLPDGRTIAYADNGNTSSLSLVLFLHGAFGVGDASRPPRVLLDRNVHFVSPSLPGWGRSSPVPSCGAYAATLASDITALITHLHPQTSHKLRLYLCAHSFGTVPAQILYGLPHHKFPLGRQLAALVLLAPHSPPHCHAEYGRAMTWPSYIMAGPPARYVPFNLVMHVVRILIAGQFSSESAAEAFMRKSMVAAMDEEERELFVQWREEQAVEEGQFEREVGRNAFRSVAHSWRGFLDLPAIYHSGWGQFCPANIESDCPVLVVSSKNDYMAPAAMAQWLAATYKSAQLKNIPGSHVSAFFHLDEIWNEVFGMESSLLDA